MAEEKKVITLNEFKTVIESVNSNIKKLGEAAQYNQEKTEKSLDKLENNQEIMKEQIVLLHEGQTEIKGLLHEKVERGEFIKLQKRVGRLERKQA